MDDVIQNELSHQIENVSFSTINPNSDIFIKKVTANPLVSVCFNSTEVHSHLIGLYNANNINAAITIGTYFDVGDEDIKEAIECYVPENNRSQLLVMHSNEIILDAYNANPSSMMVALENFVQLDKRNKVIIIGDMFELGAESLGEHKSIVDYLTKEHTIQCFFVGNDFYSNKVDKENFNFYEDFDSFAAFLKKNAFVDKTILIKGSRGMALERTLEFL
jgi:UDP-N-acetylmuramoyl-tripeptide--D-alanyl-D-alanine ligase